VLKIDSVGKVSVIIPAFNAENTIERTIGSTLSQTYKNIEVVVVNDGSIDSTANCVISKFGEDPRVRLINQTNRGVSVARTGIQESTGEYIIFLDSDDYLERDFASALVSLITSSNSDIAFCGYRSIDENETVLAFMVPRIDEGEVRNGECVLLSIFEGSMNIWTGSAIYRKDFIQRNDIIFTPGAKNGQDKEFIWKAVLKSNRIIGTRRILSNYVVRKGSLVKNAKISKAHTLGCMRRIGKFMRKNTQNERILSAFEKRMLPRSYTALIYFFAIRGFPDNRLLAISKNKGYRANLRKISLKYAKKSEFMATMGLLISPRFTILLFKFIGRLLRKDLLD